MNLLLMYVKSIHRETITRVISLTEKFQIALMIYDVNDEQPFLLIERNILR